jgi:TolB-like protein/Tfp pilus assembly protein PilF
VATILAALLLLFSGQRQGQPVVQSVAVLPFADLSPDQNHRYFADGMQEEILSRLARLENLSVASRTSVEQYRNTRKSLPIIARELGVDAIIESSVRVADERVRITVQLIDAKTDRHLWSGTFDRELSVENIFAIQQEVALQVGRELQSGVIRGSRWSLLPTRHLAAYDAYLLGRYHTYRQTPEDLTLGIAHLQEAVNLDPDFARAWAALGWAYSFEGTIYGRDAPKNVFPRAREAVTRALSIDNQLADARDLYADILAWYDWDFAAAEREYRKAMELDPMQVLGYVVFLSTQLRHEEAVGLIRRRVAATPGDPWVRVNAAWAYLHARQFDQAIAEANLAQPHTDSAAVLGFAYLGQGLTDKALAVFERDIERQGRGPRQLSHLAIANFRAGRVAQGRSLLAELEAEAGRRYLSPDLLADAYFAAGDANNGFARLFEAVDQRARGVIFVQTSLLLDGYRADPRYQSLLHAVGFQ